MTDNNYVDWLEHFANTGTEAAAGLSGETDERFAVASEAVFAEADAHGIVVTRCEGLTALFIVHGSDDFAFASNWRS